MKGHGASGGKVGGLEENKGYFSSLEECASSCEKISSMFAFGTNEYGTDRCKEDEEDGTTCKCICETAATSDGVCNQISHSGYRLYTYKHDGKGINYFKVSCINGKFTQI